jgi:hypothetical protein
MPRQPRSKAPFPNIARKWLLNKLGELLIWVILVVGFSLLPIYLVFNDKRVGGLIDVPVEDLIVKGELLLVAAGLAADSISRLISRMFAQHRRPGMFGLPQLILLLTSITFVILAATQYSGLVSRTETHAAIDSAYVFSQSRFFFIATLLTGAGVILGD